MRRLSALGIGLALGALLVTGGVRVSRQLGARQAYKMATEVKNVAFHVSGEKSPSRADDIQHHAESTQTARGRSRESSIFM